MDSIDYYDRYAVPYYEETVDLSGFRMRFRKRYRISGRRGMCGDPDGRV